MEVDEAYVTVTVNGEARRFDIAPADLCGIGRSDHNRIQISDPLASRDHAMIRRDSSGRCFLADAGSSNGTTLNGRPVTVQMPLADGDTIAIGQHRLVFHQPSAAAAEQAQRTQISFLQSLVTVLVMDVRNYTVLSRELGETQISALMAEIFRAAGELLTAKRSWSQKYIGDAIMSVWVHDKPTVEPNELAGIIDIILELRRLFTSLEARFKLARPLSFGAAINTGYASIGNMGSAALADFTALGDTVNKAFRLESATRSLNCDLIIGRSVIEFLSPPIPLARRPALIETNLKGYDAPEKLAAFQFGEIEYLRALIVAERPETTIVPGERSEAG
jgi:adenylate cyclase